jgi:hypothetical protein
MAKYLREIVQLDEGPIKSIKKFFQRGAVRKGSALDAQAYWTKLAQRGVEAGPNLKKARKYTKISGKGPNDPEVYGRKIPSFAEESELDEAIKWKKTKKGSQKVDIKTKSEIAKEKSGRSKAMRAAKHEVKDSGEKVKFQKFGRWDSLRKSAREKLKEELLSEIRHRVGRKTPYKKVSIRKV